MNEHIIIVSFSDLAYKIENYIGTYFVTRKLQILVILTNFVNTFEVF